ncbi:hypothetical protein LS73_004360 [Helicobacter muridarum]|uniref:Uncharacterized protein n=1 Tax=Helicobacter muridarum TaxID=216 RepID=A0A4U8TJZ4_9HELI|nr:hypothetical protein [Helicobacter muridarum]TLE00647.1 hypothetical protein LS73_004360 [Helicobacter muridarum]
MLNSKIDFVEKSDIEAIKSTYLSNGYCFPVEKLFIEYKDSKEKEEKIKEFSQDLILLPRTVLKIKAIKHN